MKQIKFNDFVNTSECYIGNVLLLNNNMIVPLVNTGITEGSEINISNKQLFIDKSYIFFKDIGRIIFRDGSEIDPFSDNYLLSGYNVIDDKPFEMEVECKSASVLLDNNYKLSEKLWIPIDTPRLRINFYDKFFLYKIDLDIQLSIMNI